MLQQLSSRVSRRAVLAGVLVVGMALNASAQDKYPSRTVTIVVPFPAGGTTDLLARVFAQRLTDTMGQTFVIENVGGGGGSIGADKVAKATPDGYTLLFHNLTFSTTTASLQYAGRARHDIAKDFIPISLGANVPMLLVAHPSVPAKDLKEFIAFAKDRAAKNEPLFYGSTGPGSVMNFAGEVLKRDAKIAMDHVPFRGAAPLIQEVISGRIQFGGDQLSTSLQHVRSGALKPMATLSPNRIPELPDVPTVREVGLSNMEMNGWNGFFAPAGTPEAIVNRLHEEIAKAAKHPDVEKRFKEVGAQPVGSTPAELKKFVLEQVEKVRPLITELKLVVQ